ncbi:hypothetical protein B0H14DRAFT_2632730 [Mycena olivaceomarginata]|nr:hypothetical protein B0H14DRAFT_2632730 [Mycena olivaceomarginata]
MTQPPVPQPPFYGTKWLGNILGKIHHTTVLWGLSSSSLGPLAENSTTQKMHTTQQEHALRRFERLNLLSLYTENELQDCMGAIFIDPQGLLIGTPSTTSSPMNAPGLQVVQVNRGRVHHLSPLTPDDKNGMLNNHAPEAIRTPDCLAPAAKWNQYPLKAVGTPISPHASGAVVYMGGVIHADLQGLDFRSFCESFVPLNSNEPLEFFNPRILGDHHSAFPQTKPFWESMMVMFDSQRQHGRFSDLLFVFLASFNPSCSATM